MFTLSLEKKNRYFEIFTLPLMIMVWDTYSTQWTVLSSVIIPLLSLPPPLSTLNDLYGDVIHDRG